MTLSPKPRAVSSSLTTPAKNTDTAMRCLCFFDCDNNLNSTARARVRACTSKTVRWTVFSAGLWKTRVFHRLCETQSVSTEVRDLQGKSAEVLLPLPYKVAQALRLSHFLLPIFKSGNLHFFEHQFWFYIIFEYISVDGAWSCESNIYARNEHQFCIRSHPFLTIPSATSSF